MLVEFLYCINLLISYPLMIHPTNMVIESYVFKKMKEKSSKRRWLKNLSRTLVVAATVFIGLYLRATLDKLTSVSGALTCTPSAFILPCIFHLKLCAKTKCQKFTDIVIIVFSTIIMFVITIYTFATWNNDS
jgi:proton-coupled amino acid transporter